MQLTVRPATAIDVESASVRFPDLLADRWRPADDRRSFVAVDEGGRILGRWPIGRPAWRASWMPALTACTC